MPMGPAGLDAGDLARRRVEVEAVAVAVDGARRQVLDHHAEAPLGVAQLRGHELGLLPQAHLLGDVVGHALHQDAAVGRAVHERAGAHPAGDAVEAHDAVLDHHLAVHVPLQRLPLERRVPPRPVLRMDQVAVDLERLLGAVRQRTAAEHAQARADERGDVDVVGRSARRRRGGPPARRRRGSCSRSRTPGRPPWRAGRGRRCAPAGRSTPARRPARSPRGARRPRRRPGWPGSRDTARRRPGWSSRARRPRCAAAGRSRTTLRPASGTGAARRRRAASTARST